MPNWCDFRLEIRATAGDIPAIAAAFRSRQTAIDDPQTPWLIDFSDLIVEQDSTAYFWVTADWIQLNDSVLIVSGEMKWTPPLLIMSELYDRFPSAVINCVCDTEYERFEHWVARAGKEPERVEEVVYNMRDETILSHDLRSGTSTRFHQPWSLNAGGVCTKNFDGRRDAGGISE